MVQLPRPDAVLVVADPAPLSALPGLVGRAAGAAGLPEGEPFALLVCLDCNADADDADDADADADADDHDALSDVATAATRSGVFAVATWGAGCELVHDLFDWAVVGMEIDDPDAGPVGTVMTTWHAEEPLGEVLEYFVTSTRASSDRASGRLWLVLRDQHADTTDLPGWLTDHGLPTRQLSP